MTIDINLPEFQYLADHLHAEECRRLVAALHFKSYEQPNALDQAERKISKDVPCLNALLHWNSAGGEGKGETHEAIEHRLRQIGRYDLADWLGKTVFHQLGEDLEQNLNGSFKEFLTEKQRNYTMLPTVQSREALPDPTEWLAIDTILYVAAVLLLIAIMLAVAKVVYRALSRKIKQRQTKKKDYYMLTEMSDSDDESETVYDATDNDKCTMTECEF